MDPKLTGAFIANLRNEKNWTQAELAKLLGLSDKTISKWESGSGYPDITIFPKLSQIFEVSIEELMSGNRIQKLDPMSNIEHAVIIGRTALDSLEIKGVHHTAVDEFGKDILDYVMKHESYEGLIFCFDKQLLVIESRDKVTSSDKKYFYYIKPKDSKNKKTRVYNPSGRQIPNYSSIINRILIKGGDITRLDKIEYFNRDQILGYEIEPVFANNYPFENIRLALRNNPSLYKDYLKQAVISNNKTEIMNCFVDIENNNAKLEKNLYRGISDQTMVSIIALNDEKILRRAIQLCTCQLNKDIIDMAKKIKCLWIIDDFIKKGHIAKDVIPYVTKMNEDSLIEKFELDKFNINDFIVSKNKGMITKYFDSIGKIPGRFKELVKKLVFYPVSITDDEKNEVDRLVFKYYTIVEVDFRNIGFQIYYDKERGFVKSYFDSFARFSRLTLPISLENEAQWQEDNKFKLDSFFKAIVQTSRCQLNIQVDYKLLIATNSPELIRLVVSYLPDYEKDTILSQYKAGDLKIIKALLDSGACYFLESHSQSPVDFIRNHSEKEYYNNRDMSKTNLTKLNLENAGIFIK